MTDPADDDSAMAADTTAASEDPLNHELSPRPSLPSGTAEVRAVVERCATDATGTRCTLQVEAVLRYGPATPPMAPGQRTVGVHHHLLNAHPVDQLVQEAPQKLHLSSSPPDTGTENGQPRWTLVRLLS